MLLSVTGNTNWERSIKIEIKQITNQQAFSSKFSTKSCNLAEQDNEFVNVVLVTMNF